MIERQALCDTLVEVGQDAPTLCGDWTTRDLAAHLVVRDRRPDAAPGLITSFMSGYTEQVRTTEAERPYREIVDRVRSGPPHWSPLRIDVLDRLANSLEFFVHHEDIRRARRPFTPRELEPDLEDALADGIDRGGRFLTRRLDVGLAFEPDGRTSISARKGPDRVTVAGPIGECALFVYGRKDVAQVTVRGPAAAITKVREAPLGL
jgi:uncharacterized protein (TIGR03085 family)